MGTTEAGVPAEIIQGASRIPLERASLLAAGPANCTAPQGEGSAGKEEAEASEREAASNCVGVLDGGVDDVTPVQIWNEVMEKYKTAQLCEQELQRLRGVLIVEISKVNMVSF